MQQSKVNQLPKLYLAKYKQLDISCLHPLIFGVGLMKLLHLSLKVTYQSLIKCRVLKISLSLSPLYYFESLTFRLVLLYPLMKYNQTYHLILGFFYYSTEFFIKIHFANTCKCFEYIYLNLQLDNYQEFFKPGHIKNQFYLNMHQ